MTGTRFCNAGWTTSTTNTPNTRSSFPCSWKNSLIDPRKIQHNCPKGLYGAKRSKIKINSRRAWPLSPSWGKLQASGTVQRIGLCTQQEFSWCWHWIDEQINCWKCIEKIHTLSTLIRPIFNIIPMKIFIGTCPTDFHQFFQTLFILSTGWGN